MDVADMVEERAIVGHDVGLDGPRAPEVLGRKLLPSLLGGCSDVARACAEVPDGARGRCVSPSLQSRLSTESRDGRVPRRGGVRTSGPEG